MEIQNTSGNLYERPGLDFISSAILMILITFMRHSKRQYN